MNPTAERRGQSIAEKLMARARNGASAHSFAFGSEEWIALNYTTNPIGQRVVKAILFKHDPVQFASYAPRGGKTPPCPWHTGKLQPREREIEPTPAKRTRW